MADMQRDNENKEYSDDCIEELARHIIDAMDMDDLVDYANAQMRDYLRSLSYEEVSDVIDDSDFGGCE